MERVIATLLAVALLLGGCASRPDGATDFNLNSLRYEKAWRWGNSDVLALYHQHDPALLEALARLDGIRVANFQVVRQIPRPDGTIVQQALITYYYADDVRVKKQQVELVWKLDEEARRWIVLSPMPVLR